MRFETKKKVWDYFILAARFLLAYTMIHYGWGKLTGNQFGVSEAEQAMTIKEIGLFKLSWYLFDHEPFKSFIGISQIITGLLLLWNRTCIIGALMAIPILMNILIIDITYIKMEGFYWRLSYYLVLDFLILWHYKEQMFAAISAITKSIKPKFRFSWKAYLCLPIAIVCLEILSPIIQILSGLIFKTEQTLSQLKAIPALFQKLMEQLF